MTAGMCCPSSVTDGEGARWEPLIGRLAGVRARHPLTGERDEELYLDLCQEGRIATWRGIGQHGGASGGELGAYVNACIRHAMTNYLVKQRQLRSTRAYPIKGNGNGNGNGNGSGRGAALVLSFDALNVDRLQCFVDERSQREAETRTQIALALARAGLTPCQKAAVRASLWRELTPAEESVVCNARRKLRAAMGIREVAKPSRRPRCSEETKAKIRAKLVGREFSRETRERMRVSHLGVGRPHSEETKRKIGKKSRGRKHSEATKARISAKLTGRKLPPETTQRMRVSMARSWAARVAAEGEREVSVRQGGQR